MARKPVTLDDDLRKALGCKADEMCSDGDRMTKAELAEVILDRMTGPSVKQIDALIMEHGYVRVRNAVARSVC